MNTQDNMIAAVWRAPYAQGAANIVRVRRGSTLLQIVEHVDGLPESFMDHGTICINGEAVPRALWGSIKPKPAAGGVPVGVTLHMPLRGGGGGGGGRGGGKQIIALVAAIALAAASFGIATFGVPGLFAGGTFGAKILGTAVALAGSLALSALTSPPTRRPQAQGGEDTQERGPASASGNVLQPSAVVPRVVGTRKVFPPLISQPLVELVGDDEYVEAVYALAGEHAISDIRIGDALIENADDVEYQVREGWEGDAPIDITSRYGVSQTPQLELSAHDVQDAAQDTLSDQSNPANSLPIWHAFASRNAPDEIWMHIAFAEGIADQNAPTALQRIPLRVRFRKKGAASWINCPEVHVTAAEPTLVRKAIKFVWTPRAETQELPATGFVTAYKSVPASSLTPFVGGWAADSHFSAGSGGDVLYSLTSGASNVTNTTLEYDAVTFHLDSAVHTPGIYEIEIMRGLMLVNSSFTIASYSYSGNVHDLFGYYTTGGVNKIARSRSNLQERTYISRVASVWNEHPVQKTGTALIAVKAKNRSIDQLSCVASGYVPDWDGTAWRNWTTTSNPAPHMVDAMRWKHSVYRLPEALLDSAGLVAWRSRCASEGYECNAIFEGTSFSDGARIMAACGYARPYASDLYGVIEDYDRSADTPTQIFTPRNTADFSIDKAFPRLPDGFRVRYVDEDSNYVENEEIVLRDGNTSGLNLEQVTYEGITNRDAALARASFDLAQARSRSAFYSFKAPVEYIVARRGDLIGLSYDEFGSTYGQARITKIVRDDSGYITSVYFDDIISTFDEPYMQEVISVQSVLSMADVGKKTSAAIRRNDLSVTGIKQCYSSTGASDFLEFATPFIDDDVVESSIIIVGSPDNVYKRAIVTAIVPNSDYTAQVTCVDEAPELHV